MEKTNQTTIKTLKDGPLMIEGDFTVTDANGNAIKSSRPAFLCRCGHSKNKPFCDGQHREYGFKG